MEMLRLLPQFNTCRPCCQPADPECTLLAHALRPGCLQHHESRHPPIRMQAERSQRPLFGGVDSSRAPEQNGKIGGQRCILLARANSRFKRADCIIDTACGDQVSMNVSKREKFPT